jgi:hypothetical protein
VKDALAKMCATQNAISVKGEAVPAATQNDSRMSGSVTL